MAFAAKQSSVNTIISVENPRLDAALAPAFRTYLTEQIAEGTNHIVLDMSQVEFVDSSGLGVLVSMVKQLSGVGEIKLANPGKAVLEMLRLTRMDNVFDIYTSVDEADAA